MKYHTMISGIRQKSKKDEKGWCTWLNVKEMEKMTGGGLELGTCTKSSGNEDAMNTLNELDLPIDGDEVLVTKIPTVGV